MSLKKGELQHGSFTFNTLVLPPLEILELAVAEKMVDFARVAR